MLVIPPTGDNVSSGPPIIVPLTLANGGLAIGLNRQRV